MTYAKAVLIAIDQLGNAIAGGNPDCTISGRVGYYQYNGTKPYVWYWHLLAFIIDLTFYPFDGHHHCKQAYGKEVTEKFYYTNNVAALFLLSLIVLGSCSILAPIFWVIYLIKKMFR